MTQPPPPWDGLRHGPQGPPSAALPGQPGYGGGPVPGWSGPGGYGTAGYGTAGHGPGGAAGGPPRWVPLVVGAVLLVGVLVVGGVLVARATGPSTASPAPVSTSAAPVPTSTSRSSAPSTPSPRTTSPRTSSSTTGSPEPRLPGQVAPPGSQVTYEVTGTATGVALVVLDQTGQVTTQENAVLPYSSTFTAGADFLFPSISATGSGGTLTCRISVNGAVVDEKTDQGSFALALCSAL